MCINKFVRNGDIDIPNAEFCPTSGESGSSLMSLDTNSGKYSAEGILSFTKGCSKVGKILGFLIRNNIDFSFPLVKLEEIQAVTGD